MTAEEILRRNLLGWELFPMTPVDEQEAMLDCIYSAMEEYAKHYHEQQSKWISVDPSKSNSIPDDMLNKPLWAKRLDGSGIDYIEDDEFIPLNTYSHYMEVDIPEPPTKNNEK